MYRFLLLFFSLFHILSMGFAIDPVVEVFVNPNAIGTNESAEIHVNVSGADLASVPTLSTNVDSFDIQYKGTSQQQSVTIVNGQLTSKKTVVYIYQLLPIKTGTFTIPTFKLTTQNGSVSYSPPSKITIEATGYLRQSSIPQRNNRNQNPFGAFFNEPTEIFVELRPNKTSVIQNTSFLIDVYLFSDDLKFIQNLTSIQEWYPIRYEGGLFYQLPITFDNSKIISEQYGNTTLYGRPITKYIAFPIDKGTTTVIPPVYLYRGTFQEKSIVGDPIKITSNPINNSGLTYVGNRLNLSNNLDSLNVQANQEYTFKLSIYGDGNTDFFVDPFQNRTIDNLFISSPTSEIQVGFNDDISSNDLYMEKTFSYTIIPSKAGQITIPAITLNFVNYQGRRTNVTQPAITLTVADGEQSNAVDNEFVKLEEKELTTTYYTGLYYILASIFLGLLIIISSIIVDKKRKRLSTDYAYARSSSAKKRLSGLLKDSEIAIKHNKYKDAARLIRQSILYYCTDKFNLPTSASPQEIVTFLENLQGTFEDSDIFLETLNSLDFYAFAQTPTETQIQEYLSNAYQILESISRIKFKK